MSSAIDFILQIAGGLLAIAGCIILITAHVNRESRSKIKDNLLVLSGSLSLSVGILAFMIFDNNPYLKPFGLF